MLSRFRAWLRRKSARRTLLGVALLAGVATVAVGSVRTYRYFTRDRDFCVSCHHDSRMHLRDSSHVSLPCSSCHTVTFKSSAAQYLATKFKDAKAYARHAEPDRSR